MLRLLVTMSAAVAFAAAGVAQCFQTAGGTSIAGSLIAITAFDPPDDEGRSPVTPLGFAFPMAGSAAGSYTHCVIESNGLVYLSNGGTPVFLGNYVYGSLANLAGAVGSGPRIAPFWRDNWAMPTGWDITTQAIPGVSFRVNWINTTNFNATSPARSFSATLYATGEVDFSYDNFTITSSFVGLSVGNGVGAAAAASDFAANPTGGTLGLIYEAFVSPASWDLSNRTVRFTPNGLGGWNVSTPCTSPAAGHATYGSGCYRASDSVYQRFATAAAASPVLSNTAITFTPTGAGAYTLTSGGALLPIGSVQAVPTAVANGDDVIQTVPFTVGSFPGSTGLAICSNGHVALAAGNNPTWNVTPSLLLNDPQTSFRSAHDMNPTLVGSGQILYEESPALTMVTWDGVWDYGGTSTADANTIQMQFHASGQVVIAWGALSPIGASTIGYVVGYSPGGASEDLGSIDLATSLPYTTSSYNLAAMVLAASPAPISTAAAGTLVTYTQSNLPEVVPASGTRVGITIVSLGQNLLGQDLTFLGMPGCNLHISSLDVTLAFVGTSPSLTTQFQVPAGAPYGFQFFAQSVALITPNSQPNGQNAFGATLSNGVASFVASF